MATDPTTLHRYGGEDKWPFQARLAAERMRAEIASLVDQLAERGARQLRFAPDYTDLDDPHVFIQWKGTDVCMDLHCDCGTHSHLDAAYVYAVRCPNCLKVWQFPHSVELVPLVEGFTAAIGDAE